MTTGRSQWEDLGSRPQPSWYLDPLAARQKRDAHLDLIRRWWPPSHPHRILKTDLFEEAFGLDCILPAIAPRVRFACGIDQAFSTALAAARRYPASPALASDVRHLPFSSASFDLVLSTSTLDHFAHPSDFLTAIAEIHRILRPGALLILTLDNPSNPLYAPLHWFSHTPLAPFSLGYTPSLPTLRSVLDKAGFDIEHEDFLLHNPRLVSTALFLLCRRLLGRYGDLPIAVLLRAFAALHRLPTRRWTACFQAVAARKRVPLR